MDCIFCKIVKGELPSHKVYEGDSYLAFLDIRPINPGHTLIISKNHTENMLDTSDEVLADLIKLARKIGKATTQATGAEGFNLAVNNGEAAGQLVFHLHFHIMPRFSTDPFKLWGGRQAEQGELEKVAANIREKLE